MITAEHLTRALAARRAFARATLPGTTIPIALGRVPETSRDLDRALAMATRAEDSVHNVEREAAHRFIWAAVFDVESVDTGHPEPFFPSPGAVGELDEASTLELAALVKAHQEGAIPFSADTADRARDQTALDEAIATFGPLMKLRAEHAPELVAFYGVRSALFDVTDEQVLVWWKLRDMRVRGSRDEEPAPMQHRRRTRRSRGT